MFFMFTNTWASSRARQGFVINSKILNCRKMSRGGGKKNKIKREIFLFNPVLVSLEAIESPQLVGHRSGCYRQSLKRAGGDSSTMRGIKHLLCAGQEVKCPFPAGSALLPTALSLCPRWEMEEAELEYLLLLLPVCQGKGNPGIPPSPRSEDKAGKADRKPPCSGASRTAAWVEG